MRPQKQCPTCGSWMICIWGEWKHFNESTQRWDATCPRVYPSEELER